MVNLEFAFFCTSRSSDGASRLYVTVSARSVVGVSIEGLRIAADSGKDKFS